MPQLAADLAQALDLRMNLRNRPHACENAIRARLIPRATRVNENATEFDARCGRSYARGRTGIREEDCDQEAATRGGRRARAFRPRQPHRRRSRASCTGAVQDRRARELEQDTRRPRPRVPGLADHPGRSTTVRPAAPSAALEPALLAGYALAGSAYKTNGWAVKEGITDTVTRLPLPSGGGAADPHVALGILDGLAGRARTGRTDRRSLRRLPRSLRRRGRAPRAWDGAVATSLAYQVAFGWNNAWGSVGDVRDDLDFDTEVVPKMIPEVSNPPTSASSSSSGSSPARRHSDSRRRRIRAGS